jgi:hypothetical protein
MKRLMLTLLLAGLLSAVGRSAAGDTGTYRILDYRVELTPHSDGTVAIQYYQKWLVTGGHIPWITVGTPNGNFTITGYGGAVGRIASAGEGGWSGVRLDLDRDYRPGQTFDVSFALVQRGLFYAEGNNYRLDFTPGWYDRAVTDTLRLSVRFFASLETVTATPRPSLVSGDEMAWNRHGLGEGARFTIRVSFPVALFPDGITRRNLEHAAGTGASKLPAIIGLAIFMLTAFMIIMALLSSRRRYSGGRIFYGGIFGGRSGGGGSGGGRSTGGGGGFGGASMSCACACVSCACACACAGGGGAGCSRKQEHRCPACSGRGRK